MVKKNFAIKIIIIMLVFSLIYTHSSVLLLGLNSYAYDETSKTEETEKALELEIAGAFKNNMEDGTTPYVEKMKILNTETLTTTVEDIEANLLDDEEQNQGVEIKYTSTQIVKAKMIEAIGETGTIRFTYNANKNGTVISVDVNKDTIANDDGIITLTYPETVTNLKIEINSENVQTNTLEIINNKEIEQIYNANSITKLKTKKTIKTTTNQEAEEIENIYDICYTRTVANLGIDKTEISTSIENELIFTITMKTSELKYDLYKNPYFAIELPKEVIFAQVDDVTPVNAQDFVVEFADVKEINGTNTIVMQLQGEQLQHAGSLEEETQFVIKATVATQQMMPTTETTVKMTYKNENAISYNGNTLNDTFGTDTVGISLVSGQKILTQIKAETETDNICLRENHTNSILVKTSNIKKQVKLTQTMINNVGEDLQEIKILGKSPDIGQITGIEKVYYTANEEADTDITDVANGWTKNYIQDAKQYLIIIDNFKNAETLSFKYTVSLPQEVNEETDYKVETELYNQNDQFICRLCLIIVQEAEIKDVEENEKIKAQIVIDNTNKAEVGDVKNVEIEVENVSQETVEGTYIDLKLPENLCIKTATAKIDETTVKMFLGTRTFSFAGNKVKLDPGQKLRVNLGLELLAADKQKESIGAIVYYGDENVEVSNSMNVAAKSTIITNITSNKEGKELSANEEIIYEVILINIGESNAVLDLEAIGLENMNITSKKIINKTTNDVYEASGDSLSNKNGDVKIGVGETLKFYITAVAKELKKQTLQSVYVTVKGTKIIDTETAKLTNTINKKEEVKPTPTPNPDPSEEEKEKSNITGIAWIDKNGNGRIDDTEVKLKGIQVFLIDAVTSKEVATTVTNNKGEYNFNDVLDGKYVVKFKYNTNLFKITEYKDENVEEDLDSDVINTTQNGETETKTEVIELNSDIKVNIGLILKEKFDLSINNKVSQITVNNDLGKQTYDFDNNMAKVEIKEKYFKNSMILVEYEIVVSNVEEVEGVANRISVEIPEGMSFDSELNTNWYEEGTRKIYSEELANKNLAKGENASVKLILTMNPKEAKTMNLESIAKIEETSNEYLAKDTYTKNDTSTSTVIVSIATGRAR